MITRYAHEAEQPFYMHWPDADVEVVLSIQEAIEGALKRP